jgi:hypothetical protein
MRALPRFRDLLKPGGILPESASPLTVFWVLVKLVPRRKTAIPQ